MSKILNIIKKIIPQFLFKKMQPGYHLFLNWLAGVWYRFPSEKLLVVGVTGTTGKTTTVFMIAEMLRRVGIKVGYTSTAMFSDGKKDWLNDKKMTMLGRFFTQRMLRQMVKNECQVAIIETTSEGIVQYRHRFINYDTLLFTGLYPEHIDSHGSLENYKKAKLRLFEHLEDSKVKNIQDTRHKIQTSSKLQDSNSRQLFTKEMNVDLKLSNLDLNQNSKFKIQNSTKTIIVNLDDKHAEEFLNFKVDRKIGFYQDVKLKIKNSKLDLVKYKFLEMNKIGTKFKFIDTEVQLKILGKFNALNATGAGCVGLALGLNNKQIKNGLEAIKNLPGRLEKIDEGQNFTVMVDYAFEPVAVTKLYETIQVLKPNKIIHVLGSTGGGRDMARREKLGELAGEKADTVIVANEDPYDDDPMEIIKMVAEGSKKAGKIKGQNLFLIEDRKRAIEKAVSLAGENDLVLVTGKGSEQAMAVAGGKLIPWDDRTIVSRALKTSNLRNDNNG